MDDHERIDGSCEETRDDGCEEAIDDDCQERCEDGRDLTDSAPLADALVGDEDAGYDDPQAAAASAPYIERWRRLISTTNWEKGRIILEWREALRQSGAPPSNYSDEAWSRQAGGVTPQHVGRLRRVFERFGAAYREYDGLYWSHFHAALDWDDAEMWLEGAARNRWSIAAMRAARREALGAPADLLPDSDTIIETQIDADGLSPGDEELSLSADTAGPAASQRSAEVRGADRPDSPRAGRADDAAVEPGEFDAIDSAEAAVTGEPIRPFAALASLPVDLDEALETMKLAILRHKAAGWAEVSLETVLDVLDALRALALAPREG